MKYVGINDFLLHLRYNRRKCPICSSINNVSGKFSLYCFNCDVMTERRPEMEDLPFKDFFNKWMV